MSRRPNESEQEYQARIGMERQRSDAQRRHASLADVDRERQRLSLIHI